MLIIIKALKLQFLAFSIIEILSIKNYLSEQDPYLKPYRTQTKDSKERIPWA
jgi:uncharacterized protein (UPF0305 family)